MTKRNLIVMMLFLLMSIYSWADGTSWWNTDYNTTEGQEFALTFMRNYSKEVGEQDLVLTLYATARQTTNVTIRGIWTDLGSSNSHPYRKTFTVHAGGMDSIFIPSQVAYLSLPDQTADLQWLNKGLIIESDYPISLYSHSANNKSYDASLILPIEGVYKEYVIQTYTTDAQSTEFSVVALEDGTDVEITIREQEKEKSATQKKVSVHLNAGQSYCYSPATAYISLSGTTICATSPIAVFQGGRHAQIPTDKEVASHIYHQTFSTDYWGKTYVVTRTANQTRDHVCITAAEDSTKIYKNGQLVAEIQALETHEETITWQSGEQAVVYTTSRAAECYLYQSAYKSTYGSPALTPILSVEQGVHSEILSTFHETHVSLLGIPDIGGQDTLNKYYKHYVNIVTRTENVNSMMMDESNIGAMFTSISGTPYSCAIIEIPDTAHFLTNADGLFMSRVYGIYCYAGDDEDFDFKISYAYSGGSNCLHPMWMLIDGERVDRVDICEDNGPVNFTSVINFDYSNVRWEFHHMQGTTTVVEHPKLKTSHGLSTGDSIITKKYDDVPRYASLTDHIDTVLMIVTRNTPICNFEIIDTVKAIVQVHDTFNIDENIELGMNANVCYGDPIILHYQGKEVSFIGDTTTWIHFNDSTFKLQINKPISFFDSLTTDFGCDSIINQVRILRPTYDTTVCDTLCYETLPYQWRDRSGRLVYTLTEKDLVNKTNLHLTQEHVWKVDSILKDTTLKSRYGCDSTVHVRWLVLPNYELEEDGFACADAVSPAYKDWSGHVNNSNGQALSGHQLQKWNITYNRWDNISTIDISTPGDYTYRDVMKTKYLRCKSCEDDSGCDSIVVLHLRVMDHVVVPTTHTLCDDESFLWEDTLRLGRNCPEPTNKKVPFIRYNFNSVVINVLHGSGGAEECDSTFRLTLNFQPTYRVPLNVSICDNELPYQWKVRDTKGRNEIISFHPAHDDKVIMIDSTVTLQTVNGCDSIVTLHLSIYPTFNDTTVYVACQQSGGVYHWEGHRDVPIDVPGDYIYYDSLKTRTCKDCGNGVGCDSVWVLQLHVNPVTYRYEDVVWCQSAGSYPYGDDGKQAEKTGIYRDTLSVPNQYGCDSILVVNLTVLDTIVVPVYETRCDNELPYNHPNLEAENLQGLTKTGVYRDTLKSVLTNCDSVVVLHLTVYPTYTDTFTYSVCSNEMPYEWAISDHQGIERVLFELEQDAVLPVTIEQQRTLHTIHGCDSVVTLQLTVYPTYTQIFSDTACQSSTNTYEWEGHTYSPIPLTQPGDYIYYDSLKTRTCKDCGNGVGCDSVWVLQLHVNPVTYRYEDVVWCQSAGSYPYGDDGKQAEKTGIYRDTLSVPNQYGCDSILVVNLTVLDTIVVPVYETRCDNELPYNHPNLEAENLQGLTKTGVYRDTLKSVLTNCDSVVVLHLTVYPTYTDTFTYSVCSNEMPYEWAISDHQGIERVLFELEQDAVLPVTIEQQHTLHTIHGCDSVVTLQLTIYPTYFAQNTVRISDKGEYTWIKNGVDTTVYGENHPKVLDGTIPYGLSAQDVPYLFTDSQVTQIGHTCDSVFYQYILISPTYAQVDSDAFCQYTYDEYIWHNHEGHTTIYNEHGENVNSISGMQWGEFTYVDSLKTVEGYDSIWMLHLDIWPTYVVQPMKVDTFDICDNETYHFVTVDKDTIYNTAGDWVTGDHTLGWQILEGRDTTIHGCDSVVRHVVCVHPTWAFTQDTTVCQDTIHTMWEWTDDQGGSHGTYPINKVGWFTYGDTLFTQQGCDSIFGVRIHVVPTHYFHEQLSMCDNDTISWQRRLYVGAQYAAYHKTYNETNYESIVHVDVRDGVLYDTAYYTTSGYGCDSIYYLTLTMSATHYSEQNRDVCQDDNEVYEAMHNGEGGIVPTQEAKDIIYWDTISGVNGCDSVIKMTYHIWPVYHSEKIDSTCQVYGGYYDWKNEFGDVQERISIDKGDTLIRRGTTYHTIHGCDSTFGVSLYVKPIYHFYDTLDICESDSVSWQGIWYSGSQYNAYHPENVVSTAYRRTKQNLSARQYVDTAYYQTRLGCDSIYHLCLNVYAVPHVTIERRYCQSEHDYWYECRNRGAGGYLPSQRVGTYTFVDTIQTIAHCDSIVTLIFHVDSMYDYRQQVEVCQDTINTDWEWIDEVTGASHGTIDISRPGVYTKEDGYKTIHGCDSVYGVILTVTPIYRFDSVYSICENERITWQHRTFVGDSAVLMPDDSIVLSPGVYYDTVQYLTQDLCDSTYYLMLHVHPIFDTVTRVGVCANEMYVWHQHDKWEQYKDTIWTGLDCSLSKPQSHNLRKTR